MLDTGLRDGASRHAIRHDDSQGVRYWEKQPFGEGLSMPGYVYILASRRNGTLYTGVTSDLPRRIWEHKEGITGGFTSRYGVHTLVWYEEFPWIVDAIAREKAIKNWPRRWKVELIEKTNPGWRDLSDHLVMW